VDMGQRWRREGCPHIGRLATIYAPKEGSKTLRGPPFVSVAIDVRRCSADGSGLYAGVMSPSPRLWVELVSPASLLASSDLTQPSSTGPRSSRDRAVDAVGCFTAAALGALFLSPSLHGDAVPLSTMRVVVDVASGTLACVLLWRRRRWALGVAVACLVLGTLSISATPAGLIALFSLAVHRPVRQTLLVVALWIPSILLFAVYSPTTDALSVVVRVIPLVLAVTGWGMFLRARRQILLSLRERAVRAEADQRLHEDGARRAERTRIAREMHDVLAHRISLLALHAGALEVRPDLPPEKVRETAELLRSTARQALEELRGVIGLLREDPGEKPTPPAPQPTLSDIRRLVEETRLAGTKIDFEMDVQHADAVSTALGRDAYRVVQEALTNIGKHASGTASRVRVTGGPEDGLHISVRNRKPLQANTGPVLPESGAGLLGLQERVDLAGGTLVHGPDGSGDFVVDAELTW
jgi:signal transduction histidine kinase